MSSLLCVFFLSFKMCTVKSTSRFWLVLALLGCFVLFSCTRVSLSRQLCISILDIFDMYFPWCGLLLFYLLGALTARSNYRRRGACAAIVYIG